MSFKQSILKRFRKNDEEFSKVIPIEEIGDVMKTTEGTWKTVLKISDAINSDLLSDKELLEAISSLQGALNGIGTDSTCQILISSDRVDMEKYFSSLEEKARQAEQEGDVQRAEQIRSRISYLESHAHKSRNINNFYVTLESKQKKMSNGIDELQDLSAHMIEKLAEGEVTAKKLNKEQIERVIYEKLTPITKHNQPYDPSMELTRWRPPDIRDHGSYLEMDGMKYAFYTLSYIRRKVSPGWLKKVIGIRADLDISITLRSVDKGDLVEEVNRKIVLLEEKLAGKLPPSFKNKYETQMKSLERLLDDLQDESENLFAVSFILAVRAETLEDLKSACNSLESEIRASRMRSKRLKHKGQYLMWYLLPIGFNNPNLEQKISWQLPAQTVASILPFNSSELNYQRGVLKGFNGANESPVIYDRFDDHIFYNPNEVVLGGSGSGKSFYLKVQIYREATEGNAERQFIIDPEREYLFGNRIIFKIGSGYVTNPFHIRSAVVDSDNETDETDLENYLSYKITQLVSFFRWIRPNMSELEEAFLLEGITKAYEQKGYSIENGWNGVSFHNENGQIKLNFNNPFPTLTDLDNELSKIAEAEMLRAALRPYVDGVYSSMFNGQTNWDMNDKINVLDIHELSESVQRPLMDLLIKDIWEEIKIDRKEKKGFIVDEAWILADENNQQSMEFLRSIAKRIRKYNGFLTVATQNIDDFLSVGKYGAALVKNAYIKTLMRMDEKDIEELSRFMNFSQKELRVIGKSKGRGYCIHITGNKRVEMRTDASPDEFKWLPLRKEGDKEVTAG